MQNTFKIQILRSLYVFSFFHILESLVSRQTNKLINHETNENVHVIKQINKIEMQMETYKEGNCDFMNFSVFPKIF